MPGQKKNAFEGVGNEVAVVDSSQAWANVEIPGTGNHIDSTLKRAGWDGQTPVATVMITTEGGAVKGSQYMLRGSLGIISVPLRRVQEGESTDHRLSCELDLRDLSYAEFPTSSIPAGGGPNHSAWQDGIDWVYSITVGGQKLTEDSAIRQTEFFKKKGFCLR